MKQCRDIQTLILDLENELAEKVKPYGHLVEELDKIRGIDRILAVGIIAEATTEMKFLQTIESSPPGRALPAATTSPRVKKDPNAGTGTRT